MKNYQFLFLIGLLTFFGSYLVPDYITNLLLAMIGGFVMGYAGALWFRESR